jgi:hypothetical protein
MEHPHHYRNYFTRRQARRRHPRNFRTEIEIVAEEEYYGFQWGIEDVRLFWRDDGLHGIGVIIPVDEGGEYKLRQAEILIDHAAGTFKYIKDHGRPFGHAEKNWSPPESPTSAFDFIYSSSAIVKDDEVIGEEGDLFIHNGTPLIPYEGGYLSIGHSGLLGAWRANLCTDRPEMERNRPTA